jgi:ribonuclease R
LDAVEVCVRIRARFRPHRRGFGFLTPVADDEATAVTVAVPAADGAVTEADRVFVPPPQARALVADDLVDAEVVVGDKGVVAESVTLVRRLRRLLVGTIERRRGGLVVACDGALSSGWLPLEEQLEGQLNGHDGEQVVVLARLGEAGAPVAQALVSGPHPAASPHAVRARAVALVLGDTIPSSQGVGPAAVGLDPSAADTLHLRLMGQLASGRRGAAAGLHAGGPVPGAALDGIDRRDEPCVTVDGPASRELDDAVAAAWDGDVASPVHVAVHITDVADVIGVDSDADRYARTVASTAYLTSAPSAPMLDPAVSDSTRSLLPGQDRPALSVRFAVRPDGAVDEAHVEPAWIRSHARLTYQAVEAWLAGEPKPVRTQSDVGGQAIEPTVRAALEAARRLGAERDARLTLEALFDQAELAPVVVDDEVTVALAEPHAQAYRLIERLMVAANETVGGWLAARGVPALYRAHEGIDPAAWQRLAAAAELAGASVPALAAEHGDADRIVGQLLAEVDRLTAEGREADRDLLIAATTGSTARATYDPDPSHHRGLATTAYCHFTSPLRRYADLVVHRQVRAALAGETPPHDVDELSALSGWLMVRAGALSRLEARERADLWARVLQRGELSGRETATVTGITGAGLRVRLARLGLSGFIPAEEALGGDGEGQRATLSTDAHGLTTTSGPWRVGSRIAVAFAGLDDVGRASWRLA